MSKETFEKLVRLMKRLRSENGCPWDKAQTHASIKKHLIEEAYEVCDAIDSKDPERLKDELGDLLFQVIFHSQIAKERGAFTISEVLRASHKKMLRRHPHVFGKRKATDADEAYKRWQEKKSKEKTHKGKKSLLTGVPKELPALLKAQKVLKRAAWLGFDWPDIEAAFKKIKEESQEINATVKHKNNKQFSEEIGDLLFAVANLARFGSCDAEESLNKATKKFTLRFNRLEQKLKKEGKQIKDCNLKQLEHLWNAYK